MRGVASLLAALRGGADAGNDAATATRLHDAMQRALERLRQSRNGGPGRGAGRRRPPASGLRRVCAGNDSASPNSRHCLAGAGSARQRGTGSIRRNSAPWVASNAPRGPRDQRWRCDHWKTRCSPVRTARRSSSSRDESSSSLPTKVSTTNHSVAATVVRRDARKARMLDRAGRATKRSAPRAGLKRPCRFVRAAIGRCTAARVMRRRCRPGFEPARGGRLGR